MWAWWADYSTCGPPTTTLPATYWPTGSVEDLLLRLWPAKSASPDELRKEARRSAPRMAEVAADRAT